MVEQMIFCDVSDISSPDSEAIKRPNKTANMTNYRVDVELDDVHPEASNTQISTEKNLESKIGQVKRSILTNWSATSTPVSETTNLCERKKLQLKIPPSLNDRQSRTNRKP